MEDKLKNLNESMNETFLRDVHFTDKNKQFVLKSIKKSKRFRFTSRYKGTLNIILSGLVTCVVMISPAFYSGKQLGLLKEEPSQTYTSKESTIFYPPKQDELYAEMTKEAIFNKMLNSLDYFKTVSGIFKSASIDRNGKESGGIVEYQLINQKQLSGYSKIGSVFGDPHASSTRDIYISENKRWEIKDQNYKERHFQYPTSSEKTTYTIERGSYHFITSRRDIPPIGAPQTSLFPYMYTVNYLSDFKDWEIAKQNEILLGHNTVILKGEIEHSSFRFWIDKDTGILLKYEIFDRNGKLESYLHPIEMKINIPLDTKDFKPNLSGLIKISE
ncbi:hypothetical protein ACQKP0_03060 [Heyndrickxia sp. NPDC080065]|uniref:hypothetical protein n=1 Tax=Heyndrickxia sp. NPDC080065 TaxID=3390568 RepID=UPI003D058137